MKRIATFGVFDILHIGHVRFLEVCKKLYEDSELIVGITRDSVVYEEKGKKPIFTEEERRYLVQSLKSVDRAILLDEGSDKIHAVEKIKPDIICLGYDQSFDEDELKRKLEEKGLKVEVIRLKKYGEISSTKIREKI